MNFKDAFLLAIIWNMSPHIPIRLCVANFSSIFSHIFHSLVCFNFTDTLRCFKLSFPQEIKTGWKSIQFFFVFFGESSWIFHSTYSTSIIFVCRVRLADEEKKSENSEGWSVWGMTRRETCGEIYNYYLDNIEIYSLKIGVERVVFIFINYEWNLNMWMEELYIEEVKAEGAFVFPFFCTSVFII